MKNPGQAKSLLAKALAAMPDDFSLSEARSHIRRAIESINRTEHKRGVRSATVAENPVFPRMTQEQAQKSINILDKFIKQEQTNITKSQAKPQANAKNDSVQNLND